MKLAAIQMSVSFDKYENMQNALKKIEEAAGLNADLVVLPEMFCCPYSNDFFAEYAEPARGNIWKAMSKAAAKYGIYLVAGSMPEQDGQHIYNTSFVFDRQGRQIARHRKVHLFDIDVEGGQRFKESDTFAPGGEVTVFETEFFKIGLCICFDMRFPELSRMMALEGVQAIIVPAAFNMTTGPAHWELMFRQRAVDNQLYTIGAAPARDMEGVYMSYGNSMVCSPWGDVVCRAGVGEEILVADINADMNKKIRRQLPLMNARRTDLYEVRSVR